MSENSKHALWIASLVLLIQLNKTHSQSYRHHLWFVSHKHKDTLLLRFPFLTAMSGKVILLKDLTNLGAQMKSEKSKNDLEAVARSLANKLGNLLCTFICL